LLLAALPASAFAARPEPEPEPDLFPTPDPHYVKKYYFPVRELERRLAFDMKGDDVIVFLHIQKTGGTTFGRHLVQNVRLEVPCDCRPGQKKCTCYRPNRRETWLFSRFSTGWSCGLHADWTELTNCVPGVLGKKESPPAAPHNHGQTSALQVFWDFSSLHQGRHRAGSLSVCVCSLSLLSSQPPCQVTECFSSIPAPFLTQACANLGPSRQVF
uniref:Heparan-sulfate 6-O-sulfotransferase n=1 Tax=Anolis carolinensis TaxID=28377 RepID=A0A803TK56_ANOCA